MVVAAQIRAAGMLCGRKINLVAMLVLESDPTIEE